MTALTTVRQGLALLLGVGLAAWAWLAIHEAGETPVWTCVLLSAVPIMLYWPRYSVSLDWFILPLAVWILQASGLEDAHLLVLPVVAGTLAWVAGQRGLLLRVPVAIILLFWCATAPFIGHLQFAIPLVALTLLQVLLLLLPNRAPAVRDWDLVSSSFSSNTAHMTKHFVEALREEGCTVREQRHHYVDESIEEIGAEGLILAYPVIGWKPGWTFLSWMVRELPRGKGRPAYLLYTAAGGPENAAVVAAVVLMLKGWRVVGHSWLQYPLNIPTVRLGPKRFWTWADRLLPFGFDLRLVRDHARSLARHGQAGWPLVVGYTPLVPLGLLLENPWISHVYRNYAWKRRCTGCGRCVRLCPVSRLTMVDGRPRAKGICSVCLACVNLCPTNAMHFYGFTEYGQAYPPRWPKLVVKRRKRKRAESGKGA